MLRADLPRDTFPPCAPACQPASGCPRSSARPGGAIRRRGARRPRHHRDDLHVLSNRPGKSRPGSPGLPVPGARSACWTPRAPVPGEEGVLWVRTPSRAAGYWTDPTSAAHLPGEWFRTGDVCARTPTGSSSRGREDDPSRWRGVGHAAAWSPRSWPSRRGGGRRRGAASEGASQAVAFVVPREPGRPARAWPSSRRALDADSAARAPARVRFLSELPRTATGKLQRYVLPRAGARDAAGGLRVPRVCGWSGRRC